MSDQHPYVTGDIDALERMEADEELIAVFEYLSADPAYQEWANSYDIETRRYQEAND